MSSCAKSADGWHRFRLPPTGAVLKARCQHCGVRRVYKPFADEGGAKALRVKP